MIQLEINALLLQFVCDFFYSSCLWGACQQCGGGTVEIIVGRFGQIVQFEQNHLGFETDQKGDVVSLLSFPGNDSPGQSVVYMC